MRANRIKLIGSNTALGTIRDSLTSFTDFQALATETVENPNKFDCKKQQVYKSYSINNISITFSSPSLIVFKVVT